MYTNIQLLDVNTLCTIQKRLYIYTETTIYKFTITNTKLFTCANKNASTYVLYIHRICTHKTSVSFRVRMTGLPTTLNGEVLGNGTSSPIGLVVSAAAAATSNGSSSSQQ